MERRILETKKNLFNKIILKKEHEEKQLTFIDFKNRKINIVIEGEELFIKNIKIPKVRKKYLSSIIKNEVFLRYGENILFTYSIYEEKEKEYLIKLYCFQKCRCKFLQDEKLRESSIVNIDFMQNYVKDFYSKTIKEDKYILIFNYGKYIYLLKVKKNILVFNKIVNIFKSNYDYCKKEIESFIKYNENYKFIYKVNMNDYEDILDIPNIKSLSNFNVEELLKIFFIK